MKSHSNVLCSRNFCTQQISCACRVNIEMISRSRTSRQCQFGKPNPCRNMCGLFVQRAPQWIQSFQPTEQRSISHWRKCEAGFIQLAKRPYVCTWRNLEWRLYFHDSLSSQTVQFRGQALTKDMLSMRRIPSTTTAAMITSCSLIA